MRKRMKLGGYENFFRKRKGAEAPKFLISFSQPYPGYSYHAAYAASARSVRAISHSFLSIVLSHSDKLSFAVITHAPSQKPIP